MNKRELDTKPRKSYKIRFSPEERQLVEIKAKQHGYKYLSEYIRDAAIYETVTEINISYTDDVVNAFNELITEIKKYTKEIRRILKYDTSTSDEEKELIQQSLYRVYSQTKSLKKSINDNLNIEEIIKQSRKRIYDKQLSEIEKEFGNIIAEKKGE